MKIHEKNKERLEQLKVDCSQCSGLCCTALFFSKIDGFPENKIAGKPCTKLQNNYRCKIHHELEKRNMKGCIGYDCFGAGQHVTQCIYKGETTWQTSKEQSKEIFDVFVIIFQLYQIRYFLEESRIVIPAKELWSDIENLIDENEILCNSTKQSILDIDIDSYRNKVNILLKQVCASIITSFKHNNKKLTEFSGRSFKKRDMSGLDLSMKLLIATNFDSCIFDGTIFLGADTRDTNFSNADLRESVFLTQGQINSAKGNRSTKLPKHLDYPVTWKQ